MKQIVYIITLCMALLRCNPPPGKAGNNSSVLKTTGNIKLHKLEKLFVIGDFDGDRKQDTVFQHNFSKLSKTEIEYSADPSQNEWDTVVKWFYDQGATLYLTINKSNQDTLRVGAAQGLYCLINIGDNNADGKDEIALVVDVPDFSRLNSCKIYSLCNNHWTLLKEFDIHEGSFDFKGDKAPNFHNIKGHLEKHHNKWFYKNFSQTEYTNQNGVGAMATLKLDACEIQSQSGNGDCSTL